MKKLKLIIVSLAMTTLGIWMAIGSSANNNRQPSYELQQKCTRDAEDFVIKARADKIPGAPSGLGALQKRRDDMRQHHYSARLNRCFVKLHTKLWWANNGEEDVSNDRLAIWDVNDYERGPAAEFVGFSNPDKPGRYTVSTCWAINVNNPDHFDHCYQMAGDILPADFELEKAPKWHALIKPFMEE
jgi:hypothetical protein